MGGGLTKRSKVGISGALFPTPPIPSVFQTTVILTLCDGQVHQQQTLWTQSSSVLMAFSLDFGLASSSPCDVLV